jgi:16S rRNA (guanine966-N2)-methyltransferase
MRVIAGRYGGRTLRVPAGRAIRPTSDRVKEAIFSMLGSLEGARVLDLFAGSGALAIEALSRGATAAVCVDLAPRAVATIRANAAGVGAELTVLRRDALAYVLDAGARGLRYDLVFLDPPYAEAAELGVALNRTLGPLLAPGARVVAESDRRAPLELALPLATERRYGDTLVRMHAA